MVEVKSGSTSTTITTVADKSMFNGNISHRLSTTEKCHMMLITNERRKLLFTARVYWTPSHSKYFIYYIKMGRTQSLLNEWFVDVAREYPATLQRLSIVFCD